MFCGQISRISLFGCVAAFAVAGTAARSADLPLVEPEPVPYFGGWYVRGDIGMSNQRVGNLYNVLYDAPGIHVVQPVGMTFGSAPTFAIGLGYQFNAWLRGCDSGVPRPVNLHRP